MSQVIAFWNAATYRTGRSSRVCWFEKKKTKQKNKTNRTASDEWNETLNFLSESNLRVTWLPSPPGGTRMIHEKKARAWEEPVNWLQDTRRDERSVAQKNWKIISFTKKKLNILIFFDWFNVNSFKRCWRLNCLLVDSDNAKSKLYRISSTSGQCRDQVPPGGLGCGMNCTEIFLDFGQSYRTEEDGLVMESQKKNWLREVRRRQMERPRKLAEWAEWAEKRVGSTHTHEQQLCSRNYSVVERMTDDGPLAASTLGVGDESRDLCARRSVVTCEKKIQFFIGSFHFAEFLIGQRRVIGGNIFFSVKSRLFFYDVITAFMGVALTFVYESQCRRRCLHF